MKKKNTILSANQGTEQMNRHNLIQRISKASAGTTNQVFFQANASFENGQSRTELKVV